MVKCANCRYYIRRDVNGHCRRYPPVHTRDGESMLVATNSDHWCGEFFQGKVKPETGPMELPKFDFGQGQPEISTPIWFDERLKAFVHSQLDAGMEERARGFITMMENYHVTVDDVIKILMAFKQGIVLKWT